MTDNEIIKALECCSKMSLYHIPCEDCPAIHENCLSGRILIKQALDLINRQKAEIERLKTENKDISEQFRILDVECERLEKANEKQKAEIEQLEKDKESFANSYAKAVARNLTIKAEAVEEFAETLKVNYSDFIGDCYYEDSFRAYIDNYVKEMEGEG